MVVSKSEKEEKINIYRARLPLLVFCFFISFTATYAQKQQKYEWKPVPVNGGGFVPGMIFNPTEKNLLYVRTDVGGAYIWNEEKKSWSAITDGIDNFNDWGNVSLATDPVDPNRVYLATGMYYQSWWQETASVFASADRGKTWTSTKLPFKLGGNTPGRGSGERLRVDPNSNNILYLGSQKDGLWKSDNFGKNWKKIQNFGFSNIIFVEYLKESGKSGEPTPVIYVGVCDQMYKNKLEPSIYRSKDAGATWEAIPGQPTQLDPKPVPPEKTPANVVMPCVANRVSFGGDYMYVAYGNAHTPNGDYETSHPGNNVHNGAIYKYNIKTGEWKNITPAPESMGGYSAVTVHPTNPEIVAVITICNWWPGDEIYISGDGGKTWKSVIYKERTAQNYKAIFDYKKAPYVHDHRPHWTTDLKMDPFNPNRAIFGTGYGVYVCYDFMKALEDKPTTWVFEDNGLEETVPQEIKSPPSGPLLITAIGDFDGFVHYDFNASPPHGKHFPNKGSNWSIDFAGLKPEVMVRTHDKGDTAKASYSINGGKLWHEFPTQPAKLIKNGGQIAISADGSIILWSPDQIGVYATWDFGKTWHRSKKIPVNAKPVADKVIPDQFYAKENSSGTIFVSSDSGRTFSAYGAAVGTGKGGNIEAVFGQPGHVWAACAEGGLWFSKTEGAKFKQIMNVSVCKNVSFGKAAPDAKYPAVFIHGEVSGQIGLYRSDDMGKTWIRINDDATDFARSHRTIAGDPRVYGRLYIGTEGRGVIYGDIMSEP
jgi:photosystem II stability/assembly factor-like uncharacterized protein